jgi:hypothetical protein
MFTLYLATIGAGLIFLIVVGLTHAPH